jgi:hypothetical protein
LSLRRRGRGEHKRGGKAETPELVAALAHAASSDWC